MKHCFNCKMGNNDEAVYCLSCGIKLEETEEVKATEENSAKVITADINDTIIEEQNKINTNFDNYNNQRNTGGLTAWSIVNICSIIFAIPTLYASIFTMIFGIIALVTISKAKKEPNFEYYKIYSKNALILNIVATAIAVIGFIGFIGLVISVILSAIGL